MNYDHKHQMAFLLSLAALPIAGCVIGDGDDDDTVGDTGTNTNPTMTADDDGSSGASMSASMSASMTADDTGTATVEDSGSESGSATVDDTGTTGGDVPAVCVEVGAHFEKCGFADAQERLDECIYYVDDPSQTAECIDLNEAYYACLSTAACEDLEGKENPCQAELDAIIEGCEAGGSTDTGGDSSSTG